MKPVYGSSFVDADVLCPFYLASGRRAVYCEGSEARSKTVVEHRSGGAHRDYMSRFCTAKYSLCPFFAAAMLKYTAVEEVSAIKAKGQSYEGVSLWIVTDKLHEAQFIDAPDAAAAKAEACRRWTRSAAEREAEISRRKNEGVEDWPELAAVMWRAVLKGGA